MTRTDNEQELVLGNKQLLSAFFVVVALLGVFFTMGYIIGRNTATSGVAKPVEAAGSSGGDTPSRPLEQPAAAAPPAVEIPAIETPSKPVETVTHPAKSEEASSRQQAPTPARVTRPAPKTVETSEKSAGTVIAAQSVPGHQYLQLVALKRPVADNMVKVLKERGFPALLGESSRPELFRVLVGPFSDMTTLAKAKGDLKALGFDSIILK